MSLKNKKIAVGIAGGIAAYKIPQLIRLLKKSGADVRAVMTDSATKFITELTIETVCQYPVAKKMFPGEYVATHHIDMAEWPDLFIIAPATANIIGKLSSGVCDDLLTTVLCATRTPVMIAPAMNSNMYLNPITQNNIEYLKTVGYQFIDPGEGEMACETTGIGRMREPEELFESIKEFFTPKASKKKVLKNKKVVITAGPCREPIDPVRYISNRSSGKMGFALATAAVDAGAEVILISGPTILLPADGIKYKSVETTDEMFKAVKKEFKNSDLLIMAAAPSDFKIKSLKKNKIKKEGNDNINLDLIPTVDILVETGGSKKDNQLVVGFALETENGTANARKKLKNKNLDMIVLNMVGETTPFDSDTNQVKIIPKSGRIKSLKVASKKIIAEQLIEAIAKL